MRYLFFILLFVSIKANAQDVKEIRLQYAHAVENSEILEKATISLLQVSASGNSVLLAYKGAIFTLRAKFSKSKKEKKEFFKKGISLLENAVKAAPENIEIRYIRLSVQENSPRFLGYYKNIEADKEFIMRNLTTNSPKELKAVIKDFVWKSKNFSEREKTILGKA